MVINIIYLTVIFNTFLAKKLPFIKGILLILYIMGLFTIMIPLLVLSLRNNAKAAFTEFINNGGWPIKSISFMVSLNLIVVTLNGFNSTIYMYKCIQASPLPRLTFLAKETKNAAIILLRTVIWSTALNTVMGFIMVITIVFIWGEIEEIRQTLTLYPFI